MNKIIIFFISIIFITGCSLNKNSKFWTKTKNIPEEKNENYKEIFVEEDALEKELRGDNLENSCIQKPLETIENS